MRKNDYDLYSDLYKDAHGFRPRNRSEVEGWTPEQFAAEIADLSADADADREMREFYGVSDSDALEYDAEQAERDAIEAERLEVMHDECFFGMTYDEMPGAGEDY